MLQKFNLIAANIVWYITILTSNAYLFFYLHGFYKNRNLDFIKIVGMRETSADGKYCQMKLKLINRHFEQLKTIHINVKGPIKIERVSLISSVEYFCENNFFIFSPTLLKKRAVIEFFGRGEDFLYIDFYFESEQKDRNRVIFKFREKTVAYNFFDIWRGFPAKKNQIALNKVAWVDF